MIHARPSLKYLLSLLVSIAAALSLWADDLPNRCVLPDYPYVAQMPDYCGPAALTSVLQYWGMKVDQKTVGKAVFNRKRQATHGSELLLFARKKGLSAYSWNSSITDLKEKLAQGAPVIVLQDISLKDRTGHFRVAIGYDDSTGTVLIHDPYYAKNKSMSYSAFQALWKPHGNWGLIVCPPDRDTFENELCDLNPVVHMDLAHGYRQRGLTKQSARESRTARKLLLQPRRTTKTAALPKKSPARKAPASSAPQQAEPAKKELPKPILNEPSRWEVPLFPPGMDDSSVYGFGVCLTISTVQRREDGETTTSPSA